MGNPSIYDYSFKDITGEEVHLNQFKGYVLLIVNTASQCGFTPQFKGLERLYKKYKDRNFLIIGFPCNQFQGQDPGTNEEIQSFCISHYGVTFLMAQKIDVNGPKSHPIYRHLKSEASGILGWKSIKWNFTKFLLDRKGKVNKRFPPYVKPSRISSYIEQII